jgi:acetate kinase
VNILVVNAGSSSLKLRLLDDADQVVHSADLAADADGFDESQLAAQIESWPRPDIVAHRVVHGGQEYRSAIHIDSEVRERLQALTELAPLHQPKSLAGIDAVTRSLPNAPAVACFDTAFHTTLPEAAATYAVPREWRDRYAIRRYGFHGLSHAYCSRKAAEIVDRPVDQLRMVTCHLGAGASLAAVVAGRSVDTTMGFTPLEGLVMATRSGSVDPGLVLWLEEHEGVSPHEIAVALETHSGLTALAGTGDMSTLVPRAEAGEPDAVLALDVYVHRLVAAVGAMAASAGGLDVLAFTGGAGERTPSVRSETCRRLAWMGVLVDDNLNREADSDSDLSGAGSIVRIVVVTAREDLQMAREVRVLVQGAGTSSPSTEDIGP